MAKVWHNEIFYLKDKDLQWREDFYYATEALAKRDLMRIRMVHKHQTECRIVYHGPNAIEVYEDERETPAFKNHFLKKNNSR